jgi:ATP-binding cassette, subfamily F, member 3
MNLLQLNDGYKSYGRKIIFDDARFAVNSDEHVGVIGPNGAGKTTLFKIIVGQLTLDSGDLIKSNRLRIGYLEQESREPIDISAEEHLEQSSTKPIWELKALGEELGLLPRHFAVPFHELSGGYRMRMKLLSLIGKEPNLMLLDEPTNFLDLESIMALEKFLQNYEGAFLLISHDREFLRKTTDHTLEVEGGEITKFPGHIDDYFEQKAQLRAILEAQAANQENKRKHLQDFIDRFGAKATKARQAQSRAKQIAKMDKIDIKELPVRAKIKIPAPSHTGKESLLLSNVEMGYENKKVLSSCTLRLEKGTHLGIVGFNGAGKSTFLKSVVGRIPLLAGQVQLGYQVKISYYAQHVSEELDPEDTVFLALQNAAAKDVTTQEILNLAGSLLFSGEDINKKISVLSGGEKSRVALGQILLERSPVILLDEPTNHLDFDTVTALTAALRDHPGTVIVVSHDRSFISSVSNKILEIRDGHAEIYPGTYDDYIWSLESGSLKDRFKNAPTEDEPALKTSQTSPSTVKMSVAPKESYRDRTKQLQSEIRELQKKITKHEDILQKNTDKISNLNEEILSAKGTRAADLAKELNHCGQEIQKLEDRLIEYMESLSLAENQLQSLKGV